MKTGGGEITIDDPGCLGCHASTRRNADGTFHARVHRPRPNWDAYDSWGGALPFNRDRIYKNSEEEKAVKRILNDIKDTPFGRQLGFPPGIQDNVTTGTVTIDFDNCDPGISTNDFPCKTDTGNGRLYLRVQSDSPGKGTRTDEGRGVAMFDLFNNVQRATRCPGAGGFSAEPGRYPARRARDRQRLPHGGDARQVCPEGCPHEAARVPHGPGPEHQDLRKSPRRHQPTDAQPAEAEGRSAARQPRRADRRQRQRRRQ
jgi:hypothetical protein